MHRVRRREKRDVHSRTHIALEHPSNLCSNAVMKKSIALATVLFFACSVYSQDGLDLPVRPIRFGDVQENKPIEPIDDDEDPRDTPPPVFYGEEIDTEDDTIFYVIDRSGSMRLDLQACVAANGDLVISDRMGRAKAELIRSVSNLSENFKFNIIAYDCTSLRFSSNMVEATEENKHAAITWIRTLAPSGATGTGPSTSDALSIRENKTIILLTDGIPNCGAASMAQHRAMIMNNNTQGAVINVFGIAATGQYRAFCQGVASDSGGSYFDIP
jgi:hypothetical protein